MICKICSYYSGSNRGFARHLQMHHQMKCKDYTLKFLVSEQHPVCKCGCGKETRYCNFSFKSFCTGHNSFGESNPFLGKKHSQESKDKMSRNHRGGCLKGVSRYNGSENPMFGHPHSEKTKDIISNKLKDYYKTHPNPRKGISCSEITRAKIGNSNRGRVYSTYSKNLMSLAHMGKQHTDITKQKMSKIKKEFWKNKKGVKNV